MKLKIYILIIVLSLLVGFGLAIILRMDPVGRVFGEKSVDATSLSDYKSVCVYNDISKFSTGFPFSAHKDCSYGSSGTYCNRRICNTSNYGNISVLFNGFFWSLIAYVILRVLFRKKLICK